MAVGRHPSGRAASAMASADERGRGIARRALSAQSLESLESQWKRVADIRTRLGLPALAQQREILDETPLFQQNKFTGKPMGTQVPTINSIIGKVLRILNLVNL